jgi:membrane protein required for beta-lactamase induction
VNRRATKLILRMGIPFGVMLFLVAATAVLSGWMYAVLALIMGVYVCSWWGWRSIVREINKDIEANFKKAMETEYEKGEEEFGEE